MEQPRRHRLFRLRLQHETRLLLFVAGLMLVTAGISIVALKAVRIENSKDITATTCQVTAYEPPLYAVCYVVDECFRERFPNCHSVGCNQLPARPSIGICCSETGKSCPYEVGECQVFLYASGTLFQNVSCPLHQDQCVTPGELPCYINSREHTLLLTDTRFSATDVAFLVFGVLVLLGGFIVLSFVWVHCYRFSGTPPSVQLQDRSLPALQTGLPQ